MGKVAGTGVRGFLASADAKAVLIHGPDRGAVQDAGTEVLLRWLGKSPGRDDLTRLSEDDIKADRTALDTALFSRSLLGGGLAIRLRVSSEAHSTDIAGALDAMAGRDAAKLLVEAGDLGKTSKLRKAFEAAGHAMALQLYEEDARAFRDRARQEFKAQGVRIGDDALSLFMDLAERDRDLMRREIEKLALYAADLERPIDVDDVAILIGASRIDAIDAMCEAATGGDRARLAMDLPAVLNDESPIAVLRALSRRLMRLSEARGAMARGASESVAVEQLRPPVFFKARPAFADHLRGWTEAMLERATARTWDAEIACKSAGAPQELHVARAFQAVAELASRAKR
jgi:DNA polymerase III subunit delta